MKKILLTLFDEKSQNVGANIISQLKKYGLDVNAHLYIDDTKNLSFIHIKNELLSSDISLWAIVFDEKIYEPSVCYAFSLLSIYCQTTINCPVVLLYKDNTSILFDKFTTSLSLIDKIPLLPNFGSKIVAKIYKNKPSAIDYRLNFWGNEQIGQWLEIGPTNVEWNGAMFGINKGRILFQAVGKKGGLPEKSILNYPLQDMRFTIGKIEFTGWALQNVIRPDCSYYIKIDGFPDLMVFGPFSGSDENVDAYSIELKKIVSESVTE